MLASQAGVPDPRPAGRAPSVSPLDLGELVAAAQLGEPWALRAVYEDLAPRVLGYLRSRGASDPEELTSEVFLTVFARLPALTGGPSGLRTFAFSVAHARLVDDLRRRSRRPPEARYDAERDGRTAPSAEDEAEARAAADRVRRMLSVLPVDQQAVLTLRVVADLSLEEVAEAIGRSIGAVKQLQRRGLLALRGSLDA